MAEREERDDRKSAREELIEDELKALDDVMEAIEHLDGASQTRVLRAGEALLPPPVVGTPTMR